MKYPIEVLINKMKSEIRVLKLESLYGFEEGCEESYQKDLDVMGQILKILEDAKIRESENDSKEELKPTHDGTRLVNGKLF